MRSNPVALVLAQRRQLGNTNTRHKFCSEDLGAAGFGYNFGHCKDVGVVSEEVSEAGLAFRFSDVVAFPTKFRPCISNSFVEIKAFR